MDHFIWNVACNIGFVAVFAGLPLLIIYIVDYLIPWDHESRQMAEIARWHANQDHKRLVDKRRAEKVAIFSKSFYAPVHHHWSDGGYLSDSDEYLLTDIYRVTPYKLGFEGDVPFQEFLARAMATGLKPPTKLQTMGVYSRRDDPSYRAPIMSEDGQRVEYVLRIWGEYYDRSGESIPQVVRHHEEWLFVDETNQKSVPKNVASGAFATFISHIPGLRSLAGRLVPS